jgi:D-psicose/D-tagatose/L-ribulose 3-epimerase
MNLGISTWVWTSPATTEVLEDLIPHIADLGFDVIELPVEAPGQFDLGRARTLAEQHGLGISVCAVIGEGRDLLLEEQEPQGIAYLRDCIDIAAQLGASTLVGPFYSAVGRCWRATADERARDTERLVRTLRVMSEFAAEQGVNLGIEPLNRFETSFLNTTRQAIEIVEQVDHPALGLSLDLFHMGIEEKSPGDAVREAGQRLLHVQVAENDRGTPGTGHLPWSDVASALHEIGYKGYVVIETFSERVDAIARAASIWRPLASSPDTLARDGLQFLRTLFDRQESQLEQQ